MELTRNFCRGKGSAVQVKGLWNFWKCIMQNDGETTETETTREFLRKLSRVRRVFEISTRRNLRQSRPWHFFLRAFSTKVFESSRYAVPSSNSFVVYRFVRVLNIILVVILIFLCLTIEKKQIECSLCFRPLFGRCYY